MSHTLGPDFSTRNLAVFIKFVVFIFSSMIYKYRILLPIVLFLAAIPLFFSRAYAEGINWNEPFRLTMEGSVVVSSAIAADSKGGVHIIWAYDPDSIEPDNALFYRYHDPNSATWTEPNDIFAGPDSESFSLPYVALDQADRLHLIWKGLQGLYYSSAQADVALNASSWTQPVLVVSTGSLGRASMILGQDRTIHVVFSNRRPGSNVMYVRSDDEGATWSYPIALSNIYSTDEHAPDFAGIALDKRGMLHVVWSESYPPEFIGREVLYAQSADNGLSWSAPFSLSGLREEEWTSEPNIIVDSSDKIHVMWAGCGRPVVSRCYMSSIDHGQSWSGLVSPFPNLGGSSGPDALAADPYGNVFRVGSLRYPQAVYFSTFVDEMWDNPPEAIISEESFGALGRAHFPEMAVGQGNQLHILMVEGDGGPLWYLHGQTRYPPIAPAPQSPTPQPTGILSRLSDEPRLMLTPSPTVRVDISTAQPNEILNPLFWSSLSTLVFLIMLSFTINRRQK